MTTTADEPRAVNDDAVSGRVRRLSESVSKLRRSRTGPVQLDRWLLIVGGVALPLGLVLILLGWFGAAHTGRLFEQIPYMISGGLLGLALVVGGGFCYFAYWLTRLVYEGRQQNEALLNALARIEARLDAPVDGQPGSPSANGRPAAGLGATGRLVATATGSMIHRPDCAVVADKDGLRDVSPDEPGLQPCRICQPLAELG